MKAAFFHDAPIIKRDDKFYATSFTYDVWERYLKVFNELIVSTRVRENEVEHSDFEKKYKLSSGPGVTFQPIFSYKKPIDNIFNHKEIITQIRDSLKKVDCAIIRLPSLIGSLACKEAVKMNKPYLIEVVGCAYDALSQHGSLLARLLAPLSFMDMKRAVKKSQYVIYITKDFLQGRYPTRGKTCVCPNVNISEVGHKVLENRLTKIINTNEREDTIVFGLIGSLNVHYKGHETLIKAFNLIEPYFPNFKVEFVGGGDKERWVGIARRANILNKVEFKGVIQAGDSIYKWIDRIDVAIQPSSAEAQGRSIIEEMSRACPVVSTKVGGIVELIDEKWLVEPSNEKELAKKIIDLVRNKANLIDQAKRNFRESKAYYREVIEEAREDFLNEFKNSIKS